MRAHTLAVLVVVGLVLSAGCVEMTTTTTVNAEGEIERMELRMEVNELVYAALEEDAREEGYDSVADLFEADAREDIDEEYVGDVSASTESLGDDQYLIEVTATDVDPEGIDGLSVTVEDDAVYYEDTDAFDDEIDDGSADWFEDDFEGGFDDGFEDDFDDGSENGSDDGFDDEFDDDWFDDEFGEEFDDDWFDDEFGEEFDGEFDDESGGEFDDEFENDEFDDEFNDEFGDDEFDDEFDEDYDEMFSMEYVLIMPGVIEETNADDVSDDGTTATWSFSADAEFETIYAESSIDDAAVASANETADDANESDVDGDDVPGFGVVGALGALLAVLLGLGFDRRRR